MNPRRNKRTYAFCKHFFFVGSDVSPVFLQGVESICTCYAALPHVPSAFGYLRSVGSLSGTHSTRHRNSLERRIHELANESPNIFVCKFARVELSQMPQRIHARL